MTCGLRRLVILLALSAIGMLSLHAASSWTMVPDDTLFPAPIADQNFPRFSLSFPVYVEQRIDTLQENGELDLREVFEFGGVQSLFRFMPDKDGQMATELCIGAGVITLFDSFEDHLDNFGWEGSGFLAINLRLAKHIRLSFGFHHLSSHVGDEYLANYDVVTFPADEGADLESGATYGFDYVRDSLMGGISVQLGPYARVYAMARHSMDMLRYMLCYNAFPWQADIGLELQWPDPSLRTHRWYLAFHTSAYQESSWFPSTTVQLGRVLGLQKSNRRFRFGLEYYYGRVQIASFNHTNTAEPTPWNDILKESYVAIGAWYDL